MPCFLIEPTDVLFFRDGIPMSAGQGRGSGCRIPFPSTLHEALRASLFAKYGRSDTQAAFRPKGAPRKGGWLGKGKSVNSLGSKDYQSLTVTGPFPWHYRHGVLLPVPLDVSFSKESRTLHRLSLAPQDLAPSRAFNGEDPYTPSCIPLATTPPDKHGQPAGWWTVQQYRDYLAGQRSCAQDRFTPISTEALWRAEHRVGVEIDPERSSAAEGRLFAGTFLRVDKDVRLCFQGDLRDQKAARNGEGIALAQLDWLLLGGERRLSRLELHKEDLFTDFRAVPHSPPVEDGPMLLKWVLVTPGIFARGSVPGWCQDTRKDRPGGPLPAGRVCFDLPGKAALISWCVGRPQTVTGWDILLDQAKPTQLAVPAGSVYYFLCENRATASALAAKLHWQPRSDHYGEKGCGYGLASFDAQLHPGMSPDIRHLAKTLLQR